jgi:hypothetical protein
MPIPISVEQLMFDVSIRAIRGSFRPWLFTRKNFHGEVAAGVQSCRIHAMQKRTWFWLLVTALVAAGIYFATRPGSPATSPAIARPAEPGTSPANAMANPVSRPIVSPASPAVSPTSSGVAIEDRKTIDFSSGKPEVRNTDADKAAVDAAVKEIEAATKDVTFGPAPTKP